MTAKNRDIIASCNESGLPFTRSDPLGPFCDAEVCKCEVESKRVFGHVDPNDHGAMINALFKNFGIKL